MEDVYILDDVFSGVGFMLLCLILVVVGLTVSHFAEGHRAVKWSLMIDGWLKPDERCSNGGSNAPKRGRKASIKYETSGTGFSFSGEDFQNTGTLIVVRSSVFSISSAYKTHLARDA